MYRITLSVYLVLVVLAFAKVSLAKHDQNVGIYELKSGNFSVRLTNLGARIISVVLPDNKGNLDDVVLGYDSVVEYYKNDKAYFGAIVGRVANRIGGANFTIKGKTYTLDANEGNNTLHGGRKGFSNVIWRVTKHKPVGQVPYIHLVYRSYDGDQGFPGTLAVSVTYVLLPDHQIIATMQARALGKPTPVNLAQHTYWNLGGQNSGDILSNQVQIFASHITPTNNSSIPTGEIVPVKGTPYDFLQPHIVGSKINKVPPGYDINYVIDGANGVDIKKVAVVHDTKSGRVMEVDSNALGVQFYTANNLNVKGKGGHVYAPYAGLCLETQGFPDAVNHQNFPSVIINPGKPYKHYMLYRFSTK